MSRHDALLTLSLAAFLSSVTAHAQSGQVEHYDSDGAVIHLERITPPGRVPSANPTRAYDLPGETEAFAPPPRTEPESPSAAERDREVIRYFAEAYRAGGSPRMAIYFNRELSDEVREWIPTGGAMVDSRTELSATGRRGTETLTAHSRTSSTGQIYVPPTGGRDDPREAWKWQFEDGVSRTFLEAGSKLVDRSLIFRLTAKNQPNQLGLDGTVSTSVNEISALEKYADIVVEVLVVRSSTSAVGYDFRATAKDVRTGTLLGSAYVDGADNPNPATTRFVAGSSGYEKRRFQKLPSVGDMSRMLAAQLMDGMTGTLRISKPAKTSKKRR